MLGGVRRVAILVCCVEVEPGLKPQHLQEKGICKITNKWRRNSHWPLLWKHRSDTFPTVWAYVLYCILIFKFHTVNDSWLESNVSVQFSKMFWWFCDFNKCISTYIICYYGTCANGWKADGKPNFWYLLQLEPWRHDLPVVRIKNAVLSEKGLKIEDIFHWQVCPFV